ncbi:MAG: nuclear transport factor 2 family protein [Mucilaginibacter sp.]|jgi:ketosteroid isomerase-like protein|nr:nuclear transport factor 2 family protein [Mucilaginibacter sp.]
MKKLTGLLFILSLITVTAFAQSADEKAIANQIEVMRKAMISGDKAILNSIAADDMSYGHSMDVIQTKAEFVDALVSKRSAFTKIVITNQVIHVTGNTAIVRHRLYGDTNDAGKGPGKTALGILQVWKKVNGKWLLYARQGYKLMPPNDVPPAK